MELIKVIGILSILAVYLVALGRGANFTPKACGDHAACVGDNCNTDSECQQNLGNLSYCLTSTKKCSCNGTESVASEDKGKCLLKIKEIGGVCEEKVQCTSSTPGSFSDCLEGVCNCTTGYTYTDRNIGQKHKCLKLAEKVTDPCEIQEQCSQSILGSYSQCTLIAPQQCICDPILAFERGGKCVPYAQELGTECLIDTDCTRGTPGKDSECRASPEDPTRKTCQCKPGTENEPGKHTCYEIRDTLQEPCRNNYQCTKNIGELAICLLGACSCKAGAVGNVAATAGTKCIPMVLNGERCIGPWQCYSHKGGSASCNGVCDCLTDYTTSSTLNSCLPVVKTLGGSCQEGSQCQKGIGAYSSCQDGKCECGQDAVHSGGSDTCYKRAAGIGDKCKEDIQCSSTLRAALCLNDECVCNDKAALSRDGSKCILKKALGEQCDTFEHNQCKHAGGAICKRNGATGLSYCECDEGYFLHPLYPPPLPKASCIKAASYIGDSCSAHGSQCRARLEGATCHVDSSTCECDEQTELVSENKRKCLAQVHTLNGTCYENAQCTVPNSHCLVTSFWPGAAGMCSCVEGFVPNPEDPNKCIAVSRDAGNICTGTVECLAGIATGHAKCNDVTKQCEFFKGDEKDKSTSSGNSPKVTMLLFIVGLFSLLSFH